MEAELRHVPVLSARIELRGQSRSQETIAIGPHAIRWLTANGAGPCEIKGVITTNVTAFSLADRSADRRVFRTGDFLPDGIDFTTARVARARFGGNAGSQPSQVLEKSPNGNGVILRVERGEAHGPEDEGRFTFEILIGFGNPAD